MRTLKSGTTSRFQLPPPQHIVASAYGGLQESRGRAGRASKEVKGAFGSGRPASANHPPATYPPSVRLQTLYLALQAVSVPSGTLADVGSVAEQLDGRSSFHHARHRLDPSIPARPSRVPACVTR